jgi:hypothetical protein
MTREGLRRTYFCPIGMTWTCRGESQKGLRKGRVEEVETDQIHQVMEGKLRQRLVGEGMMEAYHFPARCSVKLAMNRSSEPRMARWI